MKDNKDLELFLTGKIQDLQQQNRKLREKVKRLEKFRTLMSEENLSVIDSLSIINCTPLQKEMVELLKVIRDVTHIQDIFLPTRKRVIVDARKIFYHMVFYELSFSPDKEKDVVELSNQDRNTYKYNREKADEIMTTDKKFFNLYRTVKTEWDNYVKESKRS